MSTTGSVTLWFKEFQDGSDHAAHQLWDFYFERLVNLARRKLGVSPRQVCDEEDIALSAFKSLCKGVRHGRLNKDLDRDHLWRLMVTITVRKVYDFVKFSNRQKRNPREINGGRILHMGDSENLTQVLSREPNPAMRAQMEDQFEDLMASLVHPDLQKIVVLKMEGHTNQEIAKALNRGVSTIERKLQTIRKIWQHALES